MHNPSSHLEAAIAQPRSRSSARTTWLCMIPIAAAIAGLWGCQFPAGSGSSASDENAQSVPLPTIAPTPVLSSGETDESAADSPLRRAQRATAAAAKARDAAEKAAAASRAATLASDEAARAAAEAQAAAGLSPSNPAHRRKSAKRTSTASVVHEPERATVPAATPAITSPSATVAAATASSLSSPTADPSPGVSSITSPEPDLVSSADAAQVHSTQEDATQLIDASTASLKNVNRDSLSGRDAERYDQANRLLQSARDSMTDQDYGAAHSLASKAAVLIRLLTPTNTNSH
jgi:hypothetical protein